MYEVEIKVPADLDAVRDRLRAVGAEPAGTHRQRDVYYDAPHREFAETDEALRIRHETTLRSHSTGQPGGDRSEGSPDTTADGSDEGSTLLTYKGPLLDDDSKTRTEHETGVNDPDAVEGILSGLGFEPAATVGKRRERWTLGELTVTRDAVDGVGEFVEVERSVDDADEIAATREETKAALETLGLDPDEQVRTSYLGLLLADR